MNENKNQQQQNEGSGEQNPTLNSPGSQVADYGNTTGGSSTESPEHNAETSNPQRGNANIPFGNNETMGNP